MFLYKTKKQLNEQRTHQSGGVCGHFLQLPAPLSLAKLLLVGGDEMLADHQQDPTSHDHSPPKCRLVQNLLGEGGKEKVG